MWQELTRDIKTFAKWIVSGLLDAAFLIAWVWIQHWANRLIEHAELVGIDRWMLVALQVLFALATLVPIIIFIYTDLRIFWMRSQHSLRGERHRLDTDV